MNVDIHPSRGYRENVVRMSFKVGYREGETEIHRDMGQHGYKQIYALRFPRNGTPC